MTNYGDYCKESWNKYGSWWNTTSTGSAGSAGSAGSTGSLSGMMYDRVYGGSAGSATSCGSLSFSEDFETWLNNQPDENNDAELRIKYGHDYKNEAHDKYYYDSDAASRQDEYLRQQAEASGNITLPGNPYSGGTSPSAPSNSGEFGPSGTYVVKSGDTLSSIARRILIARGITNPTEAQISTLVNDLVKANNIKNKNLIYPGNKINY